MRFAASILLWLSLAVACGEDGLKDPFGLCSEATKEEQQAMWDVYDAFCELGHEPTCCVVFVHSPDYLMPTDVTWQEYPETHPVDPRNQAEGFRGIYSPRCHTAYVRTYGEAEPHLISLLIHELAHSVGFSHGEAMRQFERQVKEQIQK